MPANWRLKLMPVEDRTLRELRVNTVPAVMKGALALVVNAWGQMYPKS